MKKSHKWEVNRRLSIRCPHCRRWFIKWIDSRGKVGDAVFCSLCKKLFRLGRVK
ncbi:hypothetical protein LCGC14_0475400 [marine sediment metagenome]|uniref:Uncharacterized protein n=1 Tax=marine sediment metagenome TaxID=412755 RepID=A0A0F9STV2_9ZZZZ